MKEIGGYFGLENFVGEEFYPDFYALNNARNCLSVLCKAKNIKKIYIPDFLCGSVSKVLERDGYSFEYYNVDMSLRPVFEKELSDDEYLYIVNYYGQFSDILYLKERYKNIILDNVQAFFQKPVLDIDTIYSCRKFFGVPDGAYLFTTTQIDEYETDISMNRMKHILGRYEINANTFYSEFAKTGESYCDELPKKMSKLTRNLLRAIDYENVRNIRECNFDVIHSILGDTNGLSLVKPIGPYAYPYYTENAKVKRKTLQQKKIYIPTLWGDALKFGGTAQLLSENILPLPIDQRYNQEDMKYIAKELLND